MKPICSIVTVTTAGTPVALTTDKSISVNAIWIEPHPDNGAGPYYLGSSALVVSTRVGLVHVFSNIGEAFSWPQSQSGNNQISPAEYKVDVTTSGDKFLVTWWIA